MIEAHTQISFMDEDELTKMIAKSSRCQKVGIITSGDEWYLALFKTRDSKRPIAITPSVAAMLALEDYATNIDPLLNPDTDTH